MSKSHKIAVVKRTLLYLGMTISTILLVGLFLFHMMGYYFDEFGTLRQSSLLQIRTTPTAATVKVNGQAHSKLSNTKIQLRHGKYYVEIMKDGYLPWKKELKMPSGAVRWLDYVRLIPENIENKNKLIFSQISTVLASPTNHRFIVNTDPTTPELDLVKITNNDPESSKIILPQKTYTADDNEKHKKGLFEPISWSHDSSFLLVKYTPEDEEQAQFILVNINDPKKSENLSKIFGVNIETIIFTEESNDLFFAKIDGDLKKIDASAKTISAPLVRNVVEFSTYYSGKVVAFTSQSDDNEKTFVGFYSNKTKAPVIIREMSGVKPSAVHIALGTFFNVDYVIFSNDNQLEILSGVLPNNSSKNIDSLKTYKRFSAKESIDKISIVKNGGQYIVANSRAGIDVFDIAMDEQYFTKIDRSTNKLVRWITNDNFWFNKGEYLFLSEFDGANQYKITKNLPNTDIIISPDQKYLYSFVKISDNKFALQSSKIVLD